MIKFLSKILFYLSSFSILPPPRIKQEEIMRSIEKRHINSDVFLKKSLCQYDCHSYYFLHFHWLIFNTFSLLATLPLLAGLLLRSKKNLKIQRKNISLYPKIPLDIKNKFQPEFVKKPFGYLKKSDLKYVLKIILRSGFRPYFIFRSIWKIGIYSELVDTYAPENIWVTQEMVFESSLLTAYLNDLNIKHTNFMHGDNYFSIQVAFCTFNDFYVWDDFFVTLFKSLKVEANKFYVFCALDRLTSEYVEKDILKYYNQDSRDEKTLNKILDNLIVFSKKRNCDLRVRLHPLHKKKYEVDILSARGISIESNEINAIDSIYEAKYVCSEFSSILYQASLLKKNIVIDNTFPNRVAMIKDLNPIIFNKNIQLEYLVTSEEKFRKENV